MIIPTFHYLYFGIQLILNLLLKKLSKNIHCFVLNGSVDKSVEDSGDVILSG